VRHISRPRVPPTRNAPSTRRPPLHFPAGGCYRTRTDDLLVVGPIPVGGRARQPVANRCVSPAQKRRLHNGRSNTATTCDALPWPSVGPAEVLERRSVSLAPSSQLT
jgi:hypothetical protein